MRMLISHWLYALFFFFFWCLIALLVNYTICKRYGPIQSRTTVLQWFKVGIKIYFYSMTSFYTLIVSLNTTWNRKKSFFLHDSFCITFILLLALGKPFYRTPKVNVLAKLWGFICYIKTCLKITGCNDTVMWNLFNNDAVNLFTLFFLH